MRAGLEMVDAVAPRARDTGVTRRRGWLQEVADRVAWPPPHALHDFDYACGV
jgi:hypothetical protein